MFTNTKFCSSFSVNDIDAAKKFYGDTLGLKVNVDKEMGGTMLITMGSGATIFVYPKPNHEPATFTIVNFIVDDVVPVVEELTKKGITMEQYDLPEMEIKTDARGISVGEGPKMAWFKDPAGNILAVMEDWKK